MWERNQWLSEVQVRILKLQETTEAGYNAMLEILARSTLTLASMTESELGEAAATSDAEDADDDGDSRGADETPALDDDGARDQSKIDSCGYPQDSVSIAQFQDSNGAGQRFAEMSEPDCVPPSDLAVENVNPLNSLNEEPSVADMNDDDDIAEPTEKASPMVMLSDFTNNDDVWFDSPEKMEPDDDDESDTWFDSPFSLEPEDNASVTQNQEHASTPQVFEDMRGPNFDGDGVPIQSAPLSVLRSDAETIDPMSPSVFLEAYELCNGPWDPGGEISRQVFVETSEKEPIPVIFQEPNATFEIKNDSTSDVPQISGLRTELTEKMKTAADNIVEKLVFDDTSPVEAETSKLLPTALSDFHLPEEGDKFLIPRDSSDRGDLQVLDTCLDQNNAHDPLNLAGSYATLDEASSSHCQNVHKPWVETTTCFKGGGKLISLMPVVRLTSFKLGTHYESFLKFPWHYGLSLLDNQGGNHFQNFPSLKQYDVYVLDSLVLNGNKEW